MSRTARTPRRTRAAIALVAVAFVASTTLAACGGSSSDGSSDDAAPTTTSTATDADVSTYAAAAGEVATGDPVPSSGCGSSTVGSVELEKDFLDDSDRWFLLTTPLAHDGETPLPLVFDMHGLMEGADVHALMSDMAPFADENDFILVQPHGTGTPVAWNVANDRAENPDLVFVDGMLDQLEAELCVDTSRVYSTGLSNGAFLSSTLACTMSDRIAAIAPVAGVIYADGEDVAAVPGVDFGGECEPTRPVPVLAFHGTGDPILLFNGGVGDGLSKILAGEDPDYGDLPDADIDGPGFPEAARQWAASNGCTDDYTDAELTPTATERTWDCPPEGAVQFVTIDGGGHTWPGSEFSVALADLMGPTDDSIDANEIMWAFFQRFQMPSA